MALHIKTKTPKKLLTTLKSAIDDGRATTWVYDSEGDFTHTSEQWIRKAWLRPKVVEKSELIFFILAPKETVLTAAVYAVYHARLVETLLRYCDDYFEEITSSAFPEVGDITG